MPIALQPFRRALLIGLMRLHLVLIACVASLTGSMAIAQTEVAAACGLQNQVACRAPKTTKCVNDHTGYPVCHAYYRYFCKNDGLIVGRPSRGVRRCLPLPRPDNGISCCTQVRFSDHMGRDHWDVKDGFVAWIDLKKAIVQIPVHPAKTHCRHRMDRQNPFHSLPNWMELGLYHATVAINANFFALDDAFNPYRDSCGTALGAAVSNRQIVSPPARVHGFRTETLVLLTPQAARRRQREALITGPNEPYEGLHGQIQNAVSGLPLLRNGDLIPQPRNITPGSPRPRAAVALSKDGNTLLLVVVNPGVDLRKPGATLYGLAKYIGSLGFSDALTLDGSGSAQFWAKSPTTGEVTISLPSDEHGAKCPHRRNSNGRCYRPIPIFLGFY